MNVLSLVCPATELGPGFSCSFWEVKSKVWEGRVSSVHEQGQGKLERPVFPLSEHRGCSGIAVLST